MTSLLERRLIVIRMKIHLLVFKYLSASALFFRTFCIQEACKQERCYGDRMGERIAFSYLVSQKYTGEHARLDIWRDGSEVNVEVKLDRPQPLVPLHLNGRDPSYLVVAGMPLLLSQAKLYTLGVIER